MALRPPPPIGRQKFPKEFVRAADNLSVDIKLINRLDSKGAAIDLTHSIGIDEWSDPTYVAYFVRNGRLFKLEISEEAFYSESSLSDDEAFGDYEATDVMAWEPSETDDECPWRRAGVRPEDFL